MCELWNQPEPLRNTRHGLTALLDARHIEISKRRCHLKVAHPTRLNAHQPTTSRVRGDRIVRKHQATKTPHRAVQWPIPLHGRNAIGDNKLNRDGHREFDDTVVDALPVQYVSLASRRSRRATFRKNS